MNTVISCFANVGDTYQMNLMKRGTELTTQFESALNVIEEGIQFMEGLQYDDDIGLLSIIRREGIS